MDMLDGYLTADDIAAKLGVTRATVNRYHHRGDIPKCDDRVGTVPVWRQETIDRWLADRPGHGWRGRS